MNRPGWKTTEFWATVALSVAPHFGDLAAQAGPQTMLWYQAAIAAAYVVSRGMAKIQLPNTHQPTRPTTD